jgi:hypothetical protein
VYLGKRKGKVAPGLETYGGVEIQLHHSWPWLLIEVSGQLHALVIPFPKGKSPGTHWIGGYERDICQMWPPSARFLRYWLYTACHSYSSYYWEVMHEALPSTVCRTKQLTHKHITHYTDIQLQFHFSYRGPNRRHYAAS